MTNLKKVVLMLIIVMLVCVCASVTFATGDGFINITEGDLTGNTASNTTGNTANTANTTSNTSNLVGNNTSTYNNTNTTLPQTGAGDYTMILVIGIFAVSAVYAYKKIRDYKNI